MIWRQQIKFGTNVDFDSERLENIVGKGKNWLSAFSPFPTMF